MPLPDSGKLSTLRMVRTEKSSEHSCSKSLYSSEPALEMSDITQRKCKNVVCEIEKSWRVRAGKLHPFLLIFGTGMRNLSTSLLLVEFVS